MSVTLPAFTPIEETLFLTLCGRALDNRLPLPILADPMAGRLVRALGYDCDRFRLSPSPIINIAHRARKLDWSPTSRAERSPSTATPGSPSGGQAPPRHPVGRGPHQVARLRRPSRPERWNPRLQLVREILLTREPEVAEFPRGLRLLTRLAAHSTAWSRRGATVLHYRFQPLR